MQPGCYADRDAARRALQRWLSGDRLIRVFDSKTQRMQGMPGQPDFYTFKWKQRAQSPWEYAHEEGLDP